jgi:hypothetical protein
MRTAQCGCVVAYVYDVGNEAFDLERNEAKALAIGTWIGLGALIIGGLIFAVADVWWPFVSALCLTIVLGVAQVAYLARTRQWSVAAVVSALLVPERWRHPTVRDVSVVVVTALASFGIGLLAGQGPGKIASAFILGVLGAWCGARLVAPNVEADPKRPDAYPFDMFLLFGALLTFDGITGLLGETTFIEWSVGAWSLPLGVLMLVAETRRYATWRARDTNDAAPPSDGATSLKH